MATTSGQRSALCEPSASLPQASMSQLQASLAHFEDLQQRIPRADIARFEAAVRELCFAMLGALCWASGVGCMLLNKLH